MNINSPTFLTIKRMVVTAVSAVFILFAYKLGLDVTPDQIEAFAWVVVGYLIQSALRQFGSETATAKIEAAETVAATKVETVTGTSTAVDVMKYPPQPRTTTTIKP